MERSIQQYKTDRQEAVRVAARLILASGTTTTPRVGGVGECTIHIFDNPCDIEDICQKMEEMAGIKKSWAFFNRDAAMLRDADALLIATSLRCLNDPADINCNMCGKLVCEYLKEEEKLPKDPAVCQGSAAPGKSRAGQNRRPGGHDKPPAFYGYHEKRI
jgi:uncharacterized ferredoxin-like protein